MANDEDKPQNPAQPQGDPADTPPAPTPADDNNQPAPSDQGDDDQGQQPASPDAQPDADQATPSDKKKPSRGERRIRQLSEKVRQAHQPMGGVPQSPQFPQYEPGQEVPADQLQRDVVQTADAIASIRVQQQLAQHDAVRNFEQDQKDIPKSYEELNPTSPSFTPELDEAIAQEFQERALVVVGYDQRTGQPITQLDPSVRLADITERHVRAARAYAAKASADMRNRVDASADTAAPRPGGERPADREFKDLSLEEMRQKIGYHKV